MIRVADLICYLFELILYNLPTTLHYEIPREYRTGVARTLERLNDMKNSHKVLTTSVVVVEYDRTFSGGLLLKELRHIRLWCLKFLQTIGDIQCAKVPWVEEYVRKVLFSLRKILFRIDRMHDILLPFAERKFIFQLLQRFSVRKILESDIYALCENDNL